MKKKVTKKKTAVVDISNKINVITAEIQSLIKSARSNVASFANVQLTLLYWTVGERIQREILKGDRAEYGKEIIATLSQQLEREYGRTVLKIQSFKNGPIC